MYIVHVNKFRAHSSRTTKKSERTSRLQPPVEYTAPSGVQRIRILHPTKGWRDRNIDRISQNLTGLKASQFSLKAK